MKKFRVLLVSYFLYFDVFSVRKQQFRRTMYVTVNDAQCILYSWVSLCHFAGNLNRGQPHLMFMLYWSEQVLRNFTYLQPNKGTTHTVNI